MRKNSRGGGDGPRRGSPVMDIWGGQWGGLVENGAQSVLGRRTTKSRVPEGEGARWFPECHVAVTKCCHRPCTPSGRPMTPPSRLAPSPPCSIIYVPQWPPRLTACVPAPERGPHSGTKWPAVEWSQNLPITRFPRVPLQGPCCGRNFRAEWTFSWA